LKALSATPWFVSHEPLGMVRETRTMAASKKGLAGKRATDGGRSDKIGTIKVVELASIPNCLLLAFSR